MVFSWLKGLGQGKQTAGGPSLDQQIQPFVLVRGQDSTSLILNAGSYRQHIFDERAADGFEGNGYDWGSLADVFLAEAMPELQGKIRPDPEAGMFCMYAKGPEAGDTMAAFARGFSAACADEARMRDLFSRAELD